MSYDTKRDRATIEHYCANHETGWFDTPWHYVSVDYRGQELGLLIQTDDEEEARREAEELCTAFGARASVLSVRMVVIQ